MSTLSTRPPDRPQGPEPGEDDYSAAFAGWAVLLTCVVLAALVVAVSALEYL